MLPLLDDDILKTGFCWGQYQLRIDETCRLRLCKEIVVVLAERKITRLWRYPDPDGERFVLCPSEHQTTFFNAVRLRLQDLPDAEDRFRLLFSGKDAAIDRQGRIKILRACLERAHIEPPQQVTVLGVGLWYEVTAWRLSKGRSPDE